jgi:hypothetical protein
MLRRVAFSYSIQTKSPQTLQFAGFFACLDNGLNGTWKWFKEFPALETEKPTTSRDSGWLLVWWPGLESNQ